MKPFYEKFTSYLIKTQKEKFRAVERPTILGVSSLSVRVLPPDIFIRRCWQLKQVNPNVMKNAPCSDQELPLIIFLVIILLSILSPTIEVAASTVTAVWLQSKPS